MTRNKEKILKITAVTLVSIVVLIVLALTVLQIYINKNKPAFLRQANEKLSEAVNGIVVMKDLDISVWRHFPDVDIALRGLNIKDSLYRKPLLDADYVATRINIMKLITGKVDMNNIYISNGAIHIFKDTKGYSNTYIFTSKKKKKTNGKPIVINEAGLNNVSIISEDSTKDKWFGVQVNDLDAEMDYNSDAVTVTMKEDAVIKGLGFNLEKGTFLKDKSVEAKWKIKFNRNTKELSFSDNEVEIDDVPFVMSGSFFLLDSLHSKFKLAASAEKLPYAKAQSFFPQNISNKIGLVRLEDPFTVNATLEGPMSYKTIPKINVQWVVQNNEFVTPVADFKECNFIGGFTNEKNSAYPRTDDNSEIVLGQFSGNWGGVVLKGTNIIITNLVHPNLQFDLTSNTTLAALDDKLALESFSFLEGGAALSLQYNGPLISNPAILSDINGKLSIRNGTVRYNPRDLTFSKVNGDILFSQSDLLIKNLYCDLNTNHFKVDVAGNNIGKLVNNDPGKANIFCKVYTPSLDLDDFSALFKPRQTYVRKKTTGLAKPAVQLDEMLNKGTMQVDLTANAVNMRRFTAKQLTGTVLFRTNDWEVRKISLLHADGKVDLSAKVNQLNAKYHRANMNIDLQNINIKKLFYALEDFGQSAVTSSNIQGTLNAKSTIDVDLNNKGDLVPYSMNGYIDFSLKNGALINLEPLENIQKFIFKNRDLSHVEFAEIKDRFDIKGSNLYIHRMEIASSVMRIFVVGIYSLNPKSDATDISVQIPLSNLRKRPKDYEPTRDGNNSNPGASIYLRAKANNKGEVKIGLDVFKKLRNVSLEDIIKDSLQ